MAAIFARAVLAPLSLAPHSLSRVQILLSPAVASAASASKGKERAEAGKSDEVEEAVVEASVNGSIPASALPALVAQCPSLADGHFTSSPHLPSGHLQTIYSTLADTVELEAVNYRRHVLLVPDGGIISLDICDNEPDNADPHRPTVAILHGLTGGSQESYVRHCIKHLAAPQSQGGPGFRCVVVNFRGCANTPVTSAQLYSAAKTSDYRCALLYLRKRFPQTPIIGLGFSLGANVLAKYMGEEGDATPLIGGIACAAPYDLKEGSDLLETHAFRRQIYSRAMNGNLTRVAGRHAATLDLHEPFRDMLDDLLDPQRAKAFASARKETTAHSSKTLKFVDDVAVRWLGGYSKPYGEFPFNDSDHYYRNGGAILKLRGLQRPLLSLNAADDPIVAAGSIAGLKRLMGLPTVNAEHDDEEHGHTDYIVLATTNGGGHLGWWQGYRKPTRWLHAPVVDFCRALVAEQQKVRGEASALEQPETTTDEILVELMPASLLPPYVPVAERGAPSDNDHRLSNGSANGKVSTVDRHDPAFDHGARLPWLRTHLLEHAPLLHPSMARQGWCGEEPASRADFSIDTEGRIKQGGKADNSSNNAGPDVARGWCAFSAAMTRDAGSPDRPARPEVGFLELPAWTRVAGAGQFFHGGRETPGMYGLGEAGGAAGGVPGL